MTNEKSVEAFKDYNLSPNHQADSEQSHNENEVEGSNRSPDDVKMTVKQTKNSILGSSQVKVFEKEEECQAPLKFDESVEM